VGGFVFGAMVAKVTDVYLSHKKERAG